MSVTALISNISRCSLHDGPGVRTVVYFMGCPLRCKWCHNPETQSSFARTVYNSSKCIGCGKCVGICPRHHIIGNGKLIFLADGCSACGKCAELCPVRALTVIGEKMSVDEVFDELKKDIHYYGASGGGVTFSGGECLLYPDFVAALAKKCGDEGIHTVLESAFYVPWEHIETVLPFVDMFYVDLKIADHEKHKIYTGKRNEIILSNLALLKASGKPHIIRNWPRPTGTKPIRFSRRRKPERNC